MDAEGLLRLWFDRDWSGRTYVVRREQRFPLHFTSPLYLDPSCPGMAFAYFQNPTGGLFGGDRLHVEVVVGGGAETHLTTTAATKVYRTTSLPAVESVTITASGDSYVEYIPEPVIPHAGSALRQHVQVEIKDAATCLLADTLVAGRLARNECFSFDSVQRRTSISRAGQEIVVDATAFEPASWPPQHRGVFGNFAYLVSALVVSGRPEDAEALGRLEERVHALPGVLAGASVLPGNAGLAARVLAPSAGSASRALEAIWSMVRSVVNRGVPPRKRK